MTENLSQCLYFFLSRSVAPSLLSDIYSIYPYLAHIMYAYFIKRNFLLFFLFHMKYSFKTHLISFIRANDSAKLLFHVFICAYKIISTVLNNNEKKMGFRNNN